jgi:hypothetical protein
MLFRRAVIPCPSAPGRWYDRKLSCFAKLSCSMLVLEFAHLICIVMLLPASKALFQRTFCRSFPMYFRSACCIPCDRHADDAPRGCADGNGDEPALVLSVQAEISKLLRAEIPIQTGRSHKCHCVGAVFVDLNPLQRTGQVEPVSDRCKLFTGVIHAVPRDCYIKGIERLDRTSDCRSAGNLELQLPIFVAFFVLCPKRTLNLFHDHCFRRAFFRHQVKDMVAHQRTLNRRQATAAVSACGNPGRNRGHPHDP